MLSLEIYFIFQSVLIWTRNQLFNKDFFFYFKGIEHPYEVNKITAITHDLNSKIIFELRVKN